jgi:hypothetical protein
MMVLTFETEDSSVDTPKVQLLALTLEVASSVEKTTVMELVVLTFEADLDRPMLTFEVDSELSLETTEAVSAMTPVRTEDSSVDTPKVQLLALTLEVALSVEKTPVMELVVLTFEVDSELSLETTEAVSAMTPVRLEESMVGRLLVVCWK